MPREMLKNYCFEPMSPDCICERDIRCGGITTADVKCPEHGVSDRGPVDIAKTHFHIVQEVA